MDAAKLRGILRTEYGIGNEQEFDEAVAKSKGISLGIFTMPLSGRREDDKKKATAVGA